jgi:Kef-type K+ transport system membrane component KefB/nucleotide-binding universal stress UspA family protein
MRLASPDEHQVLVFLIQLAVLLLVARLLGQASRRFGLPTVVGELSAGVIIGPSVLGKALPDLFDWLFPADAVQSGMLFAVGWLGVMLLLVVTGFETDLALIARLGRAAVWVTLGSLLVPFGFGMALGYALPDSLVGPGPEGAGAGPHIFALFMAVALTISALPVIAKILSDLRLLRRNFGQLTLAVGMANDVIGWIVLGVIAGLAADGEFRVRSLVRTLLLLVLFLGASVLIGQRVIDGVLHTMRRLAVGAGGWITVIVGLALVLGAITQALGVEAVLGAFIAGVLIGRSRYTRREAQDQVEVLTTSFAAPIFFATAGLRVDLGALSEGSTLWWALVVVVIASVSKFAGSWLGARAAGLVNREGLALGSALNARGALEIVVATVGLSLGVLNDASYTIIVLMAIVTSLMASPLLRLVVRGWAGTPEEEVRLKREAQLADKVLLKPGRVLMPTVGGATAEYTATVLHAALPPESSVTIADLATGTDDPLRLVGTAQRFGRRPLESVRVPNGEVNRVLQQAGMGYRLLVAGIDATSDRELPDLVDALVRESPLPVVLVRPPRGAERSIQRILLPLSSTRPARAAAEVAIAAAERLGARLDLLYVSAGDAESGPVHRVEEHDDPAGALATIAARAGRAVGHTGHDEVGRRLMDSVADAAHENRVWPRRLFVEHSSRGLAIVETARTRQIDLVVIGVSAQDVGGNTFLGQTATHLLAAEDLGLAIVALGPR